MSTIQYADDTGLFACAKSLKTLEYLVNDDLKGVVKWISANKLSLNIPKTNYVLFTPRNKIIDYEINIKIDDTPLTRVEEAKCVGLTFDEHLTLSHIFKISHIQHSYELFIRNFQICWHHKSP